MVTITQEGNLSAPLSNALFQNLKFWVAISVPCRAALIADIKVNGGSISRVERDADYCINDPVRVNVISDRPMYSYAFVLESIKRGGLEDPEKHLIDPSALRPRKSMPASTPAAARLRRTGNQVKRRRNLFTPEEDLILLRTISQPGIALNGNKVYEELADRYPARTMHSWRGRWVDHFSKSNPDPEWWYKRLSTGRKGKGVAQEDDVEDGYEGEAEEPVMPTKVTVARPKFAPRSTLGRNKSKSLPTLGDDFTLQDDDILMAYHSAVVKAEDPLEAWEKLSERHPHHPASKWRKRYNAVILPLFQRGEAWKPNPPPSSPPRLPSPRRRSHPPAQTSTAGERSSKSRPQPHPSPRSTPPPSGVRNAVSSSSKHEIWHAEVPDLTSVPATDAPTVTSAHTDADTAKPIKRKRTRPSPARVSLATEIPSTPERGHRHKQQLRREPSPELGTSTAASQTRNEDPHPSSPQAVDNPFIEPPTPFNPVSPMFKSHPSSPDPDLKIPSLPGSPDLALYSPPVPGPPHTPDDEPDAYLMIPPLASPTPSPSPSRPPSPSQEEPESEHETLPAFVTRMKARFPGLTGPRIAWALKRTSGDKDLAEAVIAARTRGEGLPIMHGIWSEEEDAVVIGRDSRALQKLAESRGEEWEYRLKFLEEWERSKPEPRRSTV